MFLKEMQNMIDEGDLDDLLGGEDEFEDRDEMDVEPEAEEEELTDLMKYSKMLQKMISFIDELTDDGENNELAFDVEEALRDAMDKMKKLNDEVYKEVKNDEPEKEEEI